MGKFRCLYYISPISVQCEHSCTRDILILVIRDDYDDNLHHNFNNDAFKCNDGDEDDD